MLATQFSAATGLTAADVGVINDANPTSSDAIIAQSQTLIAMAEQLNESNGDALYRLGRMALAVEFGVTPDTLPEDEQGIIAHFKNPAMRVLLLLRMRHSRSQRQGKDLHRQMYSSR